jgi:hypothetical protein
MTTNTGSMAEIWLGAMMQPFVPIFFQVLPALTPDAEADVEHQPCQRDQNII